MNLTELDHAFIKVNYTNDEWELLVCIYISEHTHKKMKLLYDIDVMYSYDFDFVCDGDIIPNIIDTIPTEFLRQHRYILPMNAYQKLHIALMDNGFFLLGTTFKES